MLLHCFYLFEFKFMFEFNFCELFLKIAKSFSFSLPYFFLFWSITLTTQLALAATAHLRPSSWPTPPPLTCLVAKWGPVVIPHLRSNRTGSDPMSTGLGVRVAPYIPGRGPTNRGWSPLPIKSSPPPTLALFP
jgi:hypothetical protein